MAPQFLILPESIWRTTVGVLEAYTRAHVECGLYWYGLRNEDAAAVTVAGIAQQINRPRNFAVPDENLATLTRAIVEPLVVVAAIHTHPGVDTAHSDHDDECSVSRKIFSLVLPFYGHGANLRDASVHEFVSGGWQLLPSDDASRRVVLVPGLIDSRR